MSAIRIKDGIWSVGVINPNLRVFDIIMKTEYGTSYNAYLIKDEKNVLIDTVHERFFDEFIENIESVMPLSEIDYIVLNHAEPDHSGSLEKMLKLNPGITVIATSSAMRNLDFITNMEFNKMPVKQGDKLSIGSSVLEFVPAPFLHWPDSMFTYVPEKSVVFTCDFLGCHYCEPRIFDGKIVYPNKYFDAFSYYYEAIFSPFKSFVLDGLNKLEEMKFDMVCPSHGPVLTSGIRQCMDYYREWSSIDKKAEKNVAILYVSAYGYTEQMAKELEKTLAGEGILAESYKVTSKNS